CRLPPGPPLPFYRPGPAGGDGRWVHAGSAGAFPAVANRSKPGGLLEFVVDCAILRRVVPMAVIRAAELVGTISSLHLLEPAQEVQLPALQTGFPEARELARELLARGWLTAYQINQVFKGCGGELLLGSYVL